VIAVDVSSVMLARLNEKLARSPLANVEVVGAGFLTYEHAGEPADLVYSRFALHHLPDFWQAIALRRMAAMLRPGGVLRLSDVVYSFEPAEAEQCIEAWITELMCPTKSSTAGHEPRSPGTCATSTRRSRGCWSR
jgi:ubiquinone/menaquinone biosynthesis C-methylase UbiE